MKAGIKNYIVLNAMSQYGALCLRRYNRISTKTDRWSEELLMGILKRNKDTEIGKKFGFADIHSVEEYQTRIPYTTYEDYQEYINRMADKGEQNLMTSDNVTFFAITSGTTGVTKRIPVVKRSYQPVFRSASVIYWIIKQNMKEAGLKGGKGLITLESGCEYTPGGIRQGYISAFVMSGADAVVPALTCIPKEVFGYGEGVDMKYIKARYSLADKDLVYLLGVFMSTMTDMMKYISENREMLIRDIETGSIDPSVKLPDELRAKLESELKPDKKRAEELRAAIDPTKPEGIVRRIWPKLSTVVAIGLGEFETFTKRMRIYCGPEVHFCHKLYASSEAVFAGSVSQDAQDYMMIPDAGFFEFIPVDEEFDEEKDKPLLLHELEEGKNYEVIVTNLAGLYRYRIKDVIKVVGHHNMLPLIRFAYRKAQMINITGIKLTAEHMVSTMRALAARVGVDILDYSIYPDLDAEPWRLKVFIEFERDIPEDTDLGRIFDEELTKVNEEHGRMLKIGESSPSMVYEMNKNAYRELRAANAAKKTSDSQVKTIRYIGSEELLNEFYKKVKKVYR